MRNAMNSHADALRNPAEARPREQAAAERLAQADLDAKKRADDAVWMRVFEAQRKSPEPSQEQTLARIRQTIAEDGV